MSHQFRVHFQLPLSDLLSSFKVFLHIVLFSITHCVFKSSYDFSFMSDQLRLLFDAIQMFIQDFLFLSKPEIFKFIWLKLSSWLVLDLIRRCGLFLRVRLLLEKTLLRYLLLLRLKFWFRLFFCLLLRSREIVSLRRLWQRFHQLWLRFFINNQRTWLFNRCRKIIIFSNQHLVLEASDIIIVGLLKLKALASFILWFCVLIFIRCTFLLIYSCWLLWSRLRLLPCRQGLLLLGVGSDHRLLRVLRVPKSILLYWLYLGL